MKKNVMLTSILILLASIVFGQITEDRKGYIGISVGPAIPVGSFASRNTDNSKAGFASTGAIFDVSFAYKLKKNIGLAALLRGQYNPVNVQPLADKMNSQISGASAYTNGNGWSSGGVMAGLYSAHPLNHKATFILELKTLAGFMNTTSPQIDMTISSPEGSGWVKQHSATATSFAYLFNAGLRFNTGKRIAFTLNADYSDYMLNFKNVQMTSSAGTQESNNMTQDIHTINISAGIVFRL